MKTEFSIFALINTSIVFVFGIMFLIAGCKPNPGNWQPLAQATNSAGQRFIIAQEHYDRFEGWRVAFWFDDSDGRIYGSLLEMQTSPWRNVSIVLTNQYVEIWRGTQLVGTLDLSTRAFCNTINGGMDVYVPGFNGVQGKKLTNHTHTGPSSAFP